MLFIALSGAVNGGPVNDWYLLQADTSNIPGAPATSRWTYWNVCPERNGKTDCFGGNRAHYSHVHPAFPLDPPSGREFNTHQNIPANFIGTSFYFLMTRFMFAFMLIALFFAVMALFAGLLALCTRIGAYLSGLLTMIALFFQSINAALMTYVYPCVTRPRHANYFPVLRTSRAETISATMDKPRTSANTLSASNGQLLLASSSRQYYFA